MKKLLVVVLGFAVLFSIAAVAQESGSMGKSEKAAAAPLKTFEGTVKADGSSFVDRDGKSWNIMNPEALKGHEGHHVQIKAHVYKDKDALHVMDVKMAKDKDDKMKM